MIKLYVVKLMVISLWVTLSTVASADESKMTSSYANVPFKSCEGRGNSPASLYAAQRVTVLFSPTQIQIVNENGKKDSYASAKKMCGIDLSDHHVICRSQVESVNDDGRSYAAQKECRVPVPGVPNRDIFYRLDLDLTLNIFEVDGKKTASGFLTCVSNNDGFRGLDLSNCK